MTRTDATALLQKRVHCFPRGWHAYQNLFARAMACHHVTVAPGGEFSNRALETNPDETDAVHLHWVEYLWGGRGWLKPFREIAGVSSYLRLARRLGKRVIWTVHNHGGHEGRPFVDRIGFGRVASAADLIVVHSRWSRDHVLERYRPGCEVVVMPIGNFDGFYHPRRPPADVLRFHGLSPDVPTCGLVGGIRPYRGHELAVEAVQRSGGRLQLLIAGTALDPGYVARIREAARDPRHVAVREAPLSDDEYAEVVQACDVILLPYQAITGSAALLAAWTLGRPVVTTDLPFFREFVPADGAAGVLMREGGPDALASAVGRLLAVPAAARSTAARREAEKYDWARVVKPVASAMAAWPGWESVGERQ